MSDRQEIAVDLAADLGHTEWAFNTAFASMSSLMAKLPAYEQAARVSPVSTQAVYEEFVNACSAIVEARGKVVKGHNRLEAMRRAMKLQPVTAGSPADKPPSDTPPGFAPNTAPDMFIERAI